ncbi:hypothetical protein GCM10008026_07610 [Chelatococcus composti]|nr:hypothetical protein GCM10008026_07610 [Chelatococcus composti]
MHGRRVRLHHQLERTKMRAHQDGRQAITLDAMLGRDEAQPADHAASLTRRKQSSIR